MDRQISEALAIARSGGMESEVIMNNCEEYNRCVLPELQTSNEIKMKEKAKRARENEANEYQRSSKRSRPSHLAENEGEPKQQPPKVLTRGNTVQGETTSTITTTDESDEPKIIAGQQQQQQNITTKEKEKHEARKPTEAGTTTIKQQQQGTTTGDHDLQHEYT